MSLMFLNPRPGGPQIHLRPGGGLIWTPLLTPLLRMIAKKREGWWIAHEKLWRNYISHFFAQVNIEVVTGQRTWLVEDGFSALACDWVKLELFCRRHSIPLVTANRMMYDITILNEDISMTWHMVRSRSSFDLEYSICISINLRLPSIVS